MRRFLLVVVAACASEPTRMDAGIDAAIPDASSPVDAAEAGPSCPNGCVDTDPCTKDICDPMTGCKHVDMSACATPVCMLMTCGADTDGDGLSDGAENQKYIDLDCNGTNDGPAVDVPLPDANANVPDIYVRYDYMEKTGMGAHSHAPPAAALAQVVAAFDAHAIKLHFAAPSASIAEHQVTTLDSMAMSACAGDDFVTTKSLRAANLGNLQPAYHYMVFGHFATCPDLGHCSQCPADKITGAKPIAGSSGSADLPGDDAIVSFGAIVDSMNPVGIEFWASTIMHELGHNLSLKHGGTDHALYKPHYLSVLNYAYQLNGIPVSDAPGSTNFLTCAKEADCGPPTITNGTCKTKDACHCTDDLVNNLGSEICYRVDYSDALLPSLNELVPSPGVGGLDENVGVGGASSRDELVFYWAPGPAQLIGASNGSAIDWNNDMTIKTHVQADLNNNGTYTLLTSQNDWEMMGGTFKNLTFAYQCTMGYGAQGAHFITSEMRANEKRLWKPRPAN